MILNGSFYSITKKESIDDTVKYDIRLIPDHIIFKSHFPGKPVTPGVCILQIGQELLEEHIGKAMEIREVKNVKFLSVISPEETPCVTFTISHIQEKEDGSYKAQISIDHEAQPFAKISFTCGLCE